jgi:hypothetical protein
MISHSNDFDKVLTPKFYVQFEFIYHIVLLFFICWDYNNSSVRQFFDGSA